ncbi:MAG TPA: hypothetical protein VFV56_07985 [Gaiellaceae bacterium]|jgi:hypothetical protein|nr:hypothetical protein [Gaiellaceae bacterium]
MARFDDMLADLGASAAIPGVMGVGGGRTWDAVVATHAPALTGDRVTFVALDDGTLVINEDLPDGALNPIADQLEEMLEPPYRAAAARGEDDVWTAVAEKVRIVELTGIPADEVELAVVDGQRTLTFGDEQVDEALPPLDEIAGEHDAVAIHAERVDGDAFAVDVFPL